MNFSKIPLSASTDFIPVLVAATAIGSGTLIHTAGGAGPAFDELYVYVTNVDNAQRTLTLAYGGVTDPDNLMTKTLQIPANSGPTPIITGIPVRNGLLLKAAADVANKLLITGFVNRAA